MRHLGTAALLLVVAGCSTPGVNPPRPPAVDATPERADGLLLQGKFREAAEIYESLLQSAPAARKASYLNQVGKCRNGSGEFDAAIARFTEALTHPMSEDLRVDIYYRRGIAYNARWRPGLALLDFKRVQESPRDARESTVKTPEFLFRFGVTMQRAESWAEGRRILEQIVKDHPQSLEADGARERIPLSRFQIQIHAACDETLARRRVADAVAKGLAAEMIPSVVTPTQKIVAVGKYSRFDDAVRELDRVKSLGYADAFLIP